VIDSGLILIRNSNISKSKGERSKRKAKRSFTAELTLVIERTDDDEWNDVVVILSFLY
jgi:hypothetical protein